MVAAVCVSCMEGSRVSNWHDQGFGGQLGSLGLGARRAVKRPSLQNQNRKYMGLRACKGGGHGWARGWGFCV